MKKLAAPSYILLVILFSCHENDLFKNDTDIEKARIWFEQNEFLLSKNSSGRSADVIEKKPDWSKSKIHVTNNGIKAVEVVLEYDTYLVFSDSDAGIESERPNVINSMLLFEITEGCYELYLLKIYPEDPNTTLNENDFKDVNFGKIPASFSGSMMVFDWDENFVGGWKIVNGEKQSFYGKVQRSSDTNGRIAATQDDVTCYEITTYWYSVACVRGNCGEPILIDVTVTIVCEINPTMTPADPNENGGGDGETCFDPHPFIEGLMIPCVDPPTITNNVTDPCIRQQVENAIAEGIANQINNLVWSIFSINDEINLEFTQDESIPDGIDAETTTSGPPGGYPYSMLNVVISFNPNELDSASQEYIMATAYHELLHAILSYNGITDSQQHSSMAVQYINILASSLLEHFPKLSMDEAINLSWAGLQGTNAWNQLSQAERDNIILTNAAHKLSQNGNACN